MKKLAALLALSAAATPALAADIIEYIPPPPEPILVAAPVWTGLYVGGHVGGGFNGGGGGLPDVFVVIPGSPGSPGRPAVPGTPFVPGNPGSPGSPEVPGTPAIPDMFVEEGPVEFSFACAGAGPAAACAGAIERSGVVTPATLTRAELSAAIAAAGGDPNAAAGGAVAVEIPGRTVLIPGTPGTPGSPAVPPVAATPDQPATPGTPGIDPVAARPEQRVPFASLPGVSSFEDDSDGFVGGVHIGYDYELGSAFGGGALVIGAVADLSYVDIERFGGLSDGIDIIAARQELEYLATARLRVGAGFERVLVYATGGLAVGDVETSIVNTLTNDGQSKSDTRVGYAVGAGVDFLVTQNLSLGVEYLYTDLGSEDLSQSFNDPDYGTLGIVSNEDFDFHTVWAKASFRFN